MLVIRANTGHDEIPMTLLFRRGSTGDGVCSYTGDESTRVSADTLVRSPPVRSGTPYMVLPLFATRFADYAGGIRVSFIQPRLF